MAIDTKHLSAEEAKSLDVAEDSRETSWKSKSFMGAMFMGDLDMDIAFPFPEQEASDRAIGDEIVARIDAWMTEHVDGDAIDRNEEIPASVLRGLADLGLFGIKISTEYGGLGLSQTNYMRILGVVGTHCGSISATLSAHQSIGVPQPLKHRAGCFRGINQHGSMRIFLSMSRSSLFEPSFPVDDDLVRR